MPLLASEAALNVEHPSLYAASAILLFYHWVLSTLSSIPESTQADFQAKVCSRLARSLTSAICMGKISSFFRNVFFTKASHDIGASSRKSCQRKVCNAPRVVYVFRPRSAIARVFCKTSTENDAACAAAKPGKKTQHVRNRSTVSTQSRVRHDAYLHVLLRHLDPGYINPMLLEHDDHLV